MAGFLKRVLVGRPLATTQIAEQRLTKKIALAVFSSDALSSTAYATEEILFVVAIGASSLALGLSKLVPIAIVVAILLAIVIVSYRQVIFAYPNGGGAYVVSRENIGEMPSLVAAASLLVDYVLTVAVSISAGVAAIISIPQFEGLADHRVELGAGLIVLITLMNMRGIKESGRVFAIPTYIYVVVLGGLIVYGLARSFFGDISPVPYNPELAESTRELGGTLSLFVVLKGFSSGAVALTGVEAISNGVPAFRRPESRNAAATLVWMGVLLGTLFFGISVLADRLQPYPSHDRTVIAQLGLQVFGNGFLFVFLQFATAAILVLAANTAYNGFPSLASIIAADGYLPKQLTNRGDRLVFSNGILMLAGSAILLLVAFGGITNALIPLYAVGVFTSFTLSQAGMVRHHLKQREPHYGRSIVLNGVGAAATFVVLMIVAITKFTSGAWVPIVVIPAIVIVFKSIKHHYATVAEALSVPPDYRPPTKRLTVVVLVEQVNAGTLEALAYATLIAPDHLIAMSVVTGVEEAERIEKRWSEYGLTVPLEVVRSPFGEFTAATLAYVDEVQHRWGDAIVNVLIPEFYVDHWWGHLLHNQSTLLLKGRLLFKKRTAVTSIPYRVDPGPRKPSRFPSAHNRSPPVEFNPFDYDFHCNPYPTYEWLREHAPAYHNPKLDFWALSRFDDVLDGLHDPATYTSNYGVALEDEGPNGPAFSMIHLDPPDHTAMRKLVSRRFTPRRIAELEPRIREWTRTLLDRLEDRREFDVVTDYAALLPATVISTMLGIPPEQHDNVRISTDGLLSRESGAMTIPAHADAAMGKLVGLSVQMIALRREQPSDDILSLLVDVELDGEKLTDAQIIGFCILLISGGHETTAKLIANGVRLFGSHPEQRDDVIADASLMAPAVEELLRYTSPTQYMTRTTTRDVEMHGEVIPKGKKVALLLGSGNRDPREFERPDEFDIHRGNPRILAFGHGAHVCLGAAVARLEARVALQEFLARYPVYEVDEDAIEFMHSGNVQGPTKVPISIG